MRTGPPDTRTGLSDTRTGLSDMRAGMPDTRTGPPDMRTGPLGMRTGPADMRTGPPDMRAGPSDMRTGPSDKMDRVKQPPKLKVTRRERMKDDDHFEDLSPQSSFASLSMSTNERRATFSDSSETNHDD